MEYYRVKPGNMLALTQNLTLKEIGILTKLQWWYCANERPIPVELLDVAKWVSPARPARILQEITSLVSRFFSLKDDGWHDEELDRQIKIVSDQRDFSRENQAKSVQSRKDKLSSKRTKRRQNGAKMATNWQRDLNEIKELEFARERERREISSFSLEKEEKKQIQNPPSQDSGLMPEPGQEQTTEDDMKKIIGYDMATSKPIYEVSEIEKIADAIVLEDQKLEAFIKEEESLTTQAEKERLEAKEQEILANIKARQEAKEKEAQAIKEKELQAMMALEIRFSNWLDSQGASDQNRERMFSDCSIYAKRAKGGIKEVYGWFLEGNPYPRKEWLRNEFMERFKRSEASLGWTAQE